MILRIWKAALRATASRLCGKAFRKDPSFKNYIWDVLAAAVAIDPSVILESETLPIDVDDQYGYGYGQTMGFRGAAPEGAQNAKIVYAVDRAKVWKMVENVFNKL